MDDTISNKSNNFNFKISFLFLLVTLANYYIYVGFAIKPYMIFLLLFLTIHIGSFRFQRLHLFEVALLLFYLIYSYSGAFALYPASSVRIICGIILYIFCFFIMKSVIQNARDVVIERSLTDVGLLFNIASLILYIVGLKSLGFDIEGDRIYSFGVLLDRDYPRLIGLLQDPNFFVFYNTVFYTYYLCNAGSLKNKVGLLLCIITNILTFSRGGLLVMVLILILYILISNPIKKQKLIAGITISLCAGLFIAIEYMNFDVFGILQSRLGDLSEDGGSGRLELWSRAWDYFTSDMLFGIGASNFSDYNFFQYGDDLEVHNTFIAILSESGLLGMTCFILFIILVFLQLFQSSIPKNKPYLLLTFLGLIIQMAFLSVIINDMFFMFLAILSTYLHIERSAVISEKKITVFFSELNVRKQKIRWRIHDKGSDTTHEYTRHNR